ncbi:hypothetical protein [Flavobacterium sp. AG291]|uniref:hypothetical protein n=1 Tax=Flavobacterium sp. AG291 TaxID=2184000 RepID=UPI000E0CBB43|nr:hypothetical protein [Flavobacterium sp. AG291]RDI13213.1 hypothetical protein DEU42_103123 [Flavobacterium sp. AG291]
MKRALLYLFMVTGLIACSDDTSEPTNTNTPSTNKAIYVKVLYNLPENHIWIEKKSDSNGWNRLGDDNSPHGLVKSGDLIRVRYTLGGDAVNNGTNTDENVCMQYRIESYGNQGQWSDVECKKTVTANEIILDNILIP